MQRLAEMTNPGMIIPVTKGEISWLAQASTDSKQKGLFAVNNKAFAAVAGK
jgi:hypothetical protein